MRFTILPFSFEVHHGIVARSFASSTQMQQFHCRERADYSSKNGKVGRKEIMSHLVYGDFIVKKKVDLVSQTAL